MGKRLKSYVLIALVLGAFYFLLSHHIIFSSVRNFDLLKKNELTMKDTFVSVRSTPIVEILENDTLMDDGIEDILLKRGILTKERLDFLLDRIKAKRMKEEDSSE
jgi:hypothetical protein